MRILIKGCNVIDGISDSVRSACSVLIADGKIVQVAADITPASGDVVVDADGKYLLPGLINLHVHVNRRHLSRGTGVFRQGAPAVENSSEAFRMLYAARNVWYELSRGVTTLRDLCSVGRIANMLRNAIRDGIIRGPRIVACGMGIAATGGHETHRYKGAVEADGPEEVLKATRNELRLGADFIKVMVSGGLGGMPEYEHPGWSDYSEAEVAAAVMAAHSHHRGVTVHAMGSAPVLTALRGGVDGIEHGSVLTDEALDLMAERGVYYVPTMSGVASVVAKEKTNGNPELAALMKELVADPQLESVRNAHKRGILIGAGSDTLGSVNEEIAMMHQCGMTPMEAIKTATSNAGRILGMGDRLGCIAEGYLADLLMVENNPLDDLRSLDGVALVVCGGEIVSHEWMCNLQ